MRLIPVGATSQSIYFTIDDISSSIGGKKTGLVFNTAGLTAYYARNQGSSVVIGLNTLAAANSAWSTGGFKEVDSANMPGLYRLDVPDAAFAAGATSVVITVRGAANSAQVDIEVLLDVLVEGTLTLVGVLRILLSAVAGKSSGMSTNTPALRDLADTKNRITATTTTDGRTTITLDAS